MLASDRHVYLIVDFQLIKDDLPYVRPVLQYRKQCFYCDIITKQTANQGQRALPSLSHMSVGFPLRIFLLYGSGDPSTPNLKV